MHNFLSACAGVGLMVSSAFGGHTAVKADIHPTLETKPEAEIKTPLSVESDSETKTYEKANISLGIDPSVSVKAKSNLLLNVGL